jgi:catechol 2,3-dioxygenase-like lactoylglutathione lyase family enzyme
LRALLIFVTCLVMSPGAAAQLAAGNEAGVAMGHLHFFVDDVAAETDFWLALGGTAVPFAAGEIVEMPGVSMLISELEADGGASVVDHVAFRVASLDAIAAKGFELELADAYPGIASIYTPSGSRVELFEEGTATNVGFEADYPDAVAARHNRPLDGPIDSHHLHFYVPEDQVVPARDWYVDVFGAVPGMRWRYAAADLPGMNLNFSATEAARPATSGHRLDHIGFEINGLEAFCHELEARGIELDQSYRRVSPSFAVAILTDPWGTTLELTEGLRAL